jgi:CO/xanthine dehydrogenase Mo-binding subunit
MYSNAYSATMAEVAVNKSTGRVQVKRVVSVLDVGLTVNPDGMRQQMEGCITMGMGYALTEEVHFKDGEVLDHNFDSYSLPRFSWLPKIETVLIGNSESPATGGGEPPIITIGAVLANATYDAAGVRVPQLPMIPERVLSALKKG